MDTFQYTETKIKMEIHKMTNSRTRVLKMVQALLDEQGENVVVQKALLQDVYELLTEPYQISIEDILPEEEALWNLNTELRLKVHHQLYAVE